MPARLTALPLPRRLLFRFWVIQHVHAQQQEMYRSKRRRCADRIVSINQPYMRPIFRGKVDKSVEFGAKLNISLNGEGLACVDRLCWGAFLEGHGMKSQIEAYRARYGVYPLVVLGNHLLGARDNRCYLKRLGIRFAGKPLGQPKKVTATNKDTLKQAQAKQRVSTTHSH